MTGVREGEVARKREMKGQQMPIQAMQLEDGKEGGRKGGREGGVILPHLAELDLFGNACGSRGVEALCVCLRWRYGECRGRRREGGRLVIDLRMNQTTAGDGKELRNVMREEEKKGGRARQVVVRAAFI